MAKKNKAAGDKLGAPANRTKAGTFMPGASGNPSGRPKIPEEIKAMKNQSLQKAIMILHEKINDPKYVDKLFPSELMRFMEVICDRFGLPKVTKSEVTGEDGGPVQIIAKWDE